MRDQEKKRGADDPVLSALMHSANLVSIECNFPIDYTYHRDENLAHSSNSFNRASEYSVL